MTFSVIDAEPRHVPDIAKLEKLCFSLPWNEKMILSQYPDDMHVFLICEDETGTLAGYVGMMHVLDEGYIANVAVSPEYRRRGLGDMLIVKLIERAESLKLSFLTLEVRESNLPARALYKKHGFIDVGRRKKYYELPTEDAILMTRFL